MLLLEKVSSVIIYRPPTEAERNVVVIQELKDISTLQRRTVFRMEMVKQRSNVVLQVMVILHLGVGWLLLAAAAYCRLNRVDLRFPLGFTRNGS